MPISAMQRHILNRLRAVRIASKVSETDIEEALILGPGWVRRFESGETVPALDMLLAILDIVGAKLEDLLEGFDPADEAAQIERQIFATEFADGLNINFRYNDFDATYFLEGAHADQFEEVLKTLRSGLARLASAASKSEGALKTEAVVSAFFRAVRLWPHANPSDIWWFIINRAYCDPFNHPARFARLDHGQSWKRTGGWALEEIAVRHYQPILGKHGIRVFIADGPTKRLLSKSFKTKLPVNSDKIDVFLTGRRDGREICFGIVHVKASIAERRTDDVPLSESLIAAGYSSIFWTMDCKSMPSASPTNRGELGPVRGLFSDERNDKRKDFEVLGNFSACFSYNTNTLPTPQDQEVAARVYRCNFADPNDAFSNFVVEAWSRFKN